MYVFRYSIPTIVFMIVFVQISIADDTKNVVEQLYVMGAIRVEVDKSKPAQPIVGVTFEGKLNDRQLSALTQLPVLKKLLFIRMNISDSASKRIAKLSKLEVLSLDSCKVNKSGLRHLTSLKLLKELDLSSTAVTDDDLKQIGKLKNLRKLSLAITKINGRGLRYLTALPLETLDLGLTKISDETLLKHVAKMTHLKELLLNFADVTSMGVMHLKALKQLRTLDLEGTKVDDSVLRLLPHLKQLEELTLEVTPVSRQHVIRARRDYPRLRIKW